jgi:internalin A
MDNTVLTLLRKAATNKSEYLDLSGKSLTAAPPELWQLSFLKRLNLGNNRIKDLPAQIGQLQNLTRLDLNSNELSGLPPQLMELKGLTALDLRSNRFTKLPDVLARLASLEIVFLEGNLLDIPPEILSTLSPARILNYYSTHRFGKKRALNEAKVLVVGQGSVGKTSLVKQITQRVFNPDEHKTEGIDIHKWIVPIKSTQQVKLNVWDFGGQEIMHATHQFFLTKRSLYLLVVDTRLSAEENRIEYWLKIIKSFSRDSPVIVVGNKVDQQQLDVDQRGLLAKYSNIKAFLSTSCKTGEGIAHLRSAVATEIGKLDHINDQLLISWFAVKTRLENLREDYIPYQEYVRLCKSEKITDELSQSTLIGFLHDLGIVLNFRDDPRLEDTNILNPEWVTSGVYKILNSPLLFFSKGILQRETLTDILDPQKYPRGKHLFIMDMMRKFELCFEFEGFRDERFLIPDLLQREEVYTGEWEDALDFQYHYSVLPSSIISRFIVRLHPYIHKNTMWRTGVVLSTEQCRALVKADLEDRKIMISIVGPEVFRRQFLDRIRSNFDGIHRTIPGLLVEEKVPVPGHPEIPPVDYKHLLVLESHGIREWIPEGMVKPIDVKKLLEGIEYERARQQGQYPYRELNPKVKRNSSSLVQFPRELSDNKAQERSAVQALTIIKDTLDTNSEKFGQRCVFASLILLLALNVTLALLTRKLGWSKMEPWTYFLGVGAVIVAYGYFAISMREFSPRAMYEQLVDMKRMRNYRLAAFDLKNYEKLIQQDQDREM